MVLAYGTTGLPNSSIRQIIYTVATQFVECMVQNLGFFIPCGYGPLAGNTSRSLLFLVPSLSTSFFELPEIENMRITKSDISYFERGNHA